MADGNKPDDWTLHGKLSGRLIGGQGGGGGKGGGGSKSSTVTDTPNTLRSTQTAQLVDLLSEGPVQGLVGNANFFYSMAFDGVRVTNVDGSANFRIQDFQMRAGIPGQALLAGYPSAQAETNVSTQVKFALPIVRSITNPDADRVRLTLSVPSLTLTNPNNGKIIAYTAIFQVFVQSNGGGYGLVSNVIITGKTTSKYQRQIVFALPPGGAPWDIMVVRGAIDDPTDFEQSQTFWDSFTTIIDSPIPFNFSAIGAWTIGADQFQSIPTRVYYGNWMIVSVPTNYNPVTRQYSGAWDGSFYQSWTNNPAWVLYNVLTNRRYGLGRYIDPSKIDKWSLYQIAVWCDQYVPDGRGGYEARWAFDGVITEANDAYDMIAAIAGTFRGACYWDGSTLTTIADMPLDAVGMYTNANVINGSFTYQGADFTARHNQVLVSWQDQTNFGDKRVAIAEDQDEISTHGIRPLTMDAVACTSEARAIRLGKWALYTEKYESDLVTFTVGYDGAWCKPGDVIEIADRTKAGLRRGGRILAANVNVITLDAPLQKAVLEGAPFLSVYIDDASGGDVHIEVQQIIGVSADGATVTLLGQYTSTPAAGTVYMVSSGTLQPSIWRVQKVQASDDYTYEISALAHNASKWGFIENNIALSDPKTSAFPKNSVTNLVITDYLVELSPSSLGTRITAGWQSQATVFDFEIQPIEADGSKGITTRSRIYTTSFDTDAEEGSYRIRVTPISALGVFGSYAEKIYTVVGKTRPPSDVTSFKVDVVQGLGLFTWSPVPDLDVKIGGHYEIRYSPSSGANWSSATVALQSVPGTSSSVELPYRAGSFLIKAVDSSGFVSKNAAIIFSSQADTDYVQYIRVCEDPDWLGLNLGTQIQEPEGWLVLGTTGGAWDEQLAMIDDWPTIDVLIEGTPQSGLGYYNFDHVIDIGGVFQVRLTLDMTAFALGNVSDRIDARLDDIDSWDDFDDVNAGIDGKVTVYIAQTDDDPTDPAAVWSAWSEFSSGSYTGRAFQFYVVMTAGVGQNVAIEHLCVLVDLRNKLDQGNDILFDGPIMTIPFNVKFFLVPAVVVTVQNAAVGDHIEITSKTRESFMFRILDSGGSAVADGTRSFDWHAAGY